MSMYISLSFTVVSISLPFTNTKKRVTPSPEIFAEICVS